MTGRFLPVRFRQDLYLKASPFVDISGCRGEFRSFRQEVFDFCVTMLERVKDRYKISCFRKSNLLWTSARSFLVAQGPSDLDLPFSAGDFSNARSGARQVDCNLRILGLDY